MCVRRRLVRPRPDPRAAQRAARGLERDPGAAARGARGPGLTRAEHAALARMRPAQRRIFGRFEQRAQPQARLADGSTVSWY
jgi:hypothetical protein